MLQVLPKNSFVQPMRTFVRSFRFHHKSVSYTHLDVYKRQREYRALLAQYGSIRQSMGRTHCCFDNARMESFFATLKKELVYRLHCVSMKRDQVRQMIFRWIETYYNPLRRNTANEDHLPPLVKRRRWLSAQAQVA